MSEDIASLVVNCGAKPFNHRFFSDHRGMYVDLKMEGLFDQNLSPLASPKYRDIRSGRPRQIQKYIGKLQTLLAKTQVSARSSALKTSGTPTQAEALDREITDAMLAAGKTCAQTTRLPVSPKLHEAQTRHRILQMIVSQFKTKRDMTAQIQKKQDQLPEPFPLPICLPDALLQLRAAQRDVRTLSRQANQLKDQHRSELAEALVNSEKIGATKALERLHRAEATKEMFARLPSAKPKSSAGLSLIKIPYSGPLQPTVPRLGMTVTEPAAVEEHLLQRNRKHFSQAEPTDFAQPPLKDIFNWKGTGRTADRVLAANFEAFNDTNDNSIYSITSTADKILQCCYRRIPEITPGLTLPEMKGAYRNWRESTSTSPSGRHLGHFHALLKPDGLKRDSDEANDLAASRDEIWKIHHDMFEFGIQNAHCYT
jgi:hypothetical protein